MLTPAIWFSAIAIFNEVFTNCNWPCLLLLQLTMIPRVLLQLGIWPCCLLLSPCCIDGKLADSCPWGDLRCMAKLVPWVGKPKAGMLVVHPEKACACNNHQLCQQPAGPQMSKVILLSAAGLSTLTCFVTFAVIMLRADITK